MARRDYLNRVIEAYKERGAQARRSRRVGAPWLSILGGRMSEELLKRAIDKWGKRSQIDMMIEECAELIIALHKCTKRVFDPADTSARINDVCEELADVQLMLNQMRLLFGPKDIDDWYVVKTERLRNLLDGKPF